MEPYLFFKGTKTLDLGLHMAEALPKTSPSPRYENVTVPGRDGTLTIWDGTYDIMAVAQEFTVKDMSRIDDICALFTGSGDLISSGEPERRYLARVKTQGDLSRIIRQWHRFTVQFEMQPFARERFPQMVDNMLTKYGFSSLTAFGNSAQTVTHPGKNLLPLKSGTVSSNGITCSIASDGTITLDGTAAADTWIGVSPLLETPINPKSSWILFSPSALSYTTSITIVSGSKTGIISLSTKDDITPRVGAELNVQNGSSVVDAIPSGAGITRAWIYVASGAVCSACKFRVQLEAGNVATSWVPIVPESPSPSYQAQIHGVSKTTVNGTDYALPQALYSLPTGIADNFEIVSGQGTRQIGKMVFNGTENWTREAIDATTFRWKLMVPDAVHKQSSAGQILCSHYPSGLSTTWSKVQSITLSVIDEGAFYLFDTAHQASALSDWKSWLAAQYAAGTPVTVLYQLATPAVISGTPQTIISDSPAPAVSADNGGETNYTLSVVKVPSQNPIHLYNIGTREAQPLIRLYGTGDLTVSVNGKDFTVKDVTASATIDCESTEAYEDSEPLVTIGDFPTLPPGESTVSFTGATKIEITPNWRWI